MMNVMMDATLKSLELVSDFQSKNEELARSFIDQAGKNRAQVMKMTQQSAEMVKKQVAAQETFVKDVMELTRKTFLPAKK